VPVLAQAEAAGVVFARPDPRAMAEQTGHNGDAPGRIPLPQL
jgi:hypothetical protein